MLHQEGTRIVDEHGRSSRRGVNLGGWLLWESSNLAKGILTSQTTILTRLEKAASPWAEHDETDNGNTIVA